MTNSLRIVVADDERDMRDYLSRILPRLGHQVVAAAATGEELVRRCRELRPDLVVTDIRMPGMDGIEAAAEIYRDLPLPIVLVSAYHDPEFIARAEEDHVLAYLVKPVKQADLQTAIAIATARFEQFRHLEHEAESLRQALADRKLIERAKGVLMQERDISDVAAFEVIRAGSRHHKRRMVDEARSVLKVEEGSDGISSP
jgi:response regulator NasT